jgi:tripartite-type tricarboxylate transporter receptor subunit TctC
VPYKGSPPAIAGLLGGEVQMMFANLTDIGSQLKSGKVKPLAVTGARRAPTQPDIPTMQEAGVPGFEIMSWFGLLAPAGTPAPIVARLNGVVNASLASDALKESLKRLGAEPTVQSADEFSAFIAAETHKWTAIADAAHIKLD